MLNRALSMVMCFSVILGIAAGCGTKEEVKPTTATSSESAKATEKPTEKPKEVVTLKFLTGKVETVDLVNQMIAKFQTENPGIKVEQEYQKDASNVIKIKFASGDVPDITTVVSQDYIDQGKYLDLSNAAFWSRVLPAVKDLNTDIKTGKQFSAAATVTMGGIFYNKQIFSELGLKEALTWADFKTNLKTIKEKKKGVVPMFLPGKEAWSMGHLIEFMAHGIIKQQYGVYESRKAFINNDGAKLAFDAPGGSMETFAARIMELKNEGLINADALTATYDNEKEDFVAGKAAMFSQGMWVLGDLLKINPDFAKNIGFSPFPALQDGGKPVVLSAEDSKYAITSASKHPEEAKKFLDFLFKAENLKLYSEAIKSPSAFTDVKADWGPLQDQATQALKTGVNIAFTDTPSGFSGDDVGRMVQELIAGKYKTPADFAKTYKETWDKGWKASK
ncbi:ABC transporter substrate-binding protein [Paenibacillus sp. Soil750]|uniref:ABC transporter substrate-binding protein n=1 Tax=Paenibacillus sp. Soil750 TaxID=1736398 RepID=UPI0006FE3777|nr:extracellular solute-binding protein [Paenibacillus sp. Soil750]KRE58008.1 hypothetical protein ASL11_30800 [Paenibacillus sp. Soil750]